MRIPRLGADLGTSTTTAMLRWPDGRVLGAVVKAGHAKYTGG